MRYLPAILLITLLSTAGAEDTSFKEATDKKKSLEKKKYGPYAGVFGGSLQGQEAESVIEYPDVSTTINGVPGIIPGYDAGYDLSDRDGDVIFGFEVGYSWKQKKFPFEVALEFEGFYMSSEFNGTVNEAFAESLPGDGITSYHTDMSSVSFMVNAHLTLDLSRYRARIGNFLPRLRPFVGAGAGGTQLWFRNTTTTTQDPLKTASYAPFAVDDFVFSWQVFGGLEYKVNEKFSLYAEYRQIHMEDFAEISDYKAEAWLAGIRIRY